MIEIMIEGKGLEPALRQMERSDAIRVLGPHISAHYPGAEVDGMRVAVKVRAASTTEARDLVRSYLPPDGNYIVRPALA